MLFVLIAIGLEYMAFREYMHLEKFGNTEVEGIELGKIYVFPKIDGTNASIWREFIKGDGEKENWAMCAGSRTRKLSREKDNAGFCVWVEERALVEQQFLIDHPNLRLYGEWLVPHSFTGYRPDAWKKFYVFDVYNDAAEQYLPYEVYKPLLDAVGIEYIPAIAEVKNGDYGRFLTFLEQNLYLIPDGGQPGEGIVLKNYDYYNKFGRQCWAKIVRNEFKEIHAKAMGAPFISASLMNEERLVDKGVTPHLVEKTYAKICNSEGGWSSKAIPQLFERVFYDLITEELWDIWKELGFATINGKTVKALTINKIKQLKPELF
jgi:hypothetical protein